MDSLDPLHWGMLGMIALLSASVLMLAQNHLELEGRVVERELASPTPAELRLAVDESRLAVGESLRAHGRLDTHHRQIQSLAKELGWADDRARTRIMGSPSEPPPP
jgi:hypothetical protein